QEHFHLVRRHPVVGGAGVLLLDRADEGAGFDAGDVRGVGCAVERVGFDVLVEAGEGAWRAEPVGQGLPLLVRASDPGDALGCGQCGDLSDPGGKPAVAGGTVAVDLQCWAGDRHWFGFPFRVAPFGNLKSVLCLAGDLRSPIVNTLPSSPSQYRFIVLRW